MTTKSFRIGECAVGGIIKAEVKGWSDDIIQIKALDWNSKEIVREMTILSKENNVQNKLDNFLNDLTTSYYADKIMTWIKSKANLG